MEEPEGLGFINSTRVLVGVTLFPKEGMGVAWEETEAVVKITPREKLDLGLEFVGAPHWRASRY